MKREDNVNVRWFSLDAPGGVYTVTATAMGTQATTTFTLSLSMRIKPGDRPDELHAVQNGFSAKKR